MIISSRKSVYRKMNAICPEEQKKTENRNDLDISKFHADKAGDK
jgi:hypothetical protein